MVIATQNPVEMEGTYPLPEAQRDRFMARVSMGYPDAARRDGHARRARGDRTRSTSSPRSPTPRSSRAWSTSCAPSTSPPSIRQYAVDIANATRTAPRRAPRRVAARHPAPRARRQGRGRPRRPRPRAARRPAARSRRPVLAHRLHPHRRRPDRRRARTETSSPTSCAASPSRPPRGPDRSRPCVPRCASSPDEDACSSWAGAGRRARVAVLGQRDLLRVGVLLVALPLLVARCSCRAPATGWPRPRGLRPTRVTVDQADHERRPPRERLAAAQRAAPRRGRRALAAGPLAALRARPARVRRTPRRPVRAARRGPRPLHRRARVACSSSTRSACAARRASSPPPTPSPSSPRPSPCPAIPLGGDWSGLGEARARAVAVRRRGRRHPPRVPHRRRPAPRALEVDRPQRRAHGAARGAAVAHRAPPSSSTPVRWRTAATAPASSFEWAVSAAASRRRATSRVAGTPCASSTPTATLLRAGPTSADGLGRRRGRGPAARHASRSSRTTEGAAPGVRRRRAAARACATACSSRSSATSTSGTPRPSRRCARPRERARPSCSTPRAGPLALDRCRGRPRRAHGRAARGRRMAGRGVRARRPTSPDTWRTPRPRGRHRGRCAMTATGRRPGRARPRRAARSAPDPRAQRPGVVGPTVATGSPSCSPSLALGPALRRRRLVRRHDATVIAVVAVAGGSPPGCARRCSSSRSSGRRAVRRADVSRFTDDDAPWGFVPSPTPSTSCASCSPSGTDRHRPVRAAGARDRGAHRPSSRSASAAWRSSSSCCRCRCACPAIAGLPLVAIYVVPSFVLAGRRAVVGVRRASCAGWLLLLVADERLTLIGWGRMLRRQDKRSSASPLAGVSSAAVPARRRRGRDRARPADPRDPGPRRRGHRPRTGPAAARARATASGGEPASIGARPVRGAARNLLNNPDVTVLTYRTTDSTPRLPASRGASRTSTARPWKPVRFSPDTGATRSPTASTRPPACPPTCRARSTATTSPRTSSTAGSCRSPRSRCQVGADGDWYVDQARPSRCSAPTTPAHGADAAGGRGRSRCRPTPAQLDAPRLRSRAASAPPRAGHDRSPSLARRDGAPADRRRDDRTSTRLPSPSSTGCARVHLQHRRDSRDSCTSSYLEQFLRDRVGYCEQFAATMALMARSLGIPVARGRRLHPRARQERPGRVRRRPPRTRTRGPSCYFTGIGWVRFEPTPRGRPTAAPSPCRTGPAPTPSGGPDEREPTREGVPNNRQVPEEDNGTPNAISEVPDATAAVDPADQLRRRALVGLLARRGRRRCSSPPPGACCAAGAAWRRPRASRTPGASCATPPVTSASRGRTPTPRGRRPTPSSDVSRSWARPPTPPPGWPVPPSRCATPRPRPRRTAWPTTCRRCAGRCWRRAEWKARIRAVFLPVSLRRTAP